MAPRKKKVDIKQIEQALPKSIEIDMSMYETLKADWLSKDFVIENQDRIYRFDNRGTRFYLKWDGKTIVSAPGVTSVLKKTAPMGFNLVEWYAKHGMDKANDLMFEAQNYGVLMHITFGRLLRGETIDLEDIAMDGMIEDFCLDHIMPWQMNKPEWRKKLKQDIIGFIQWVQDFEVVPLAIEYPFVFENSGLAYSGTIDLVCRLKPRSNAKDKIIAIVDFKSGRHDFYDDSAIQLKAYQNAWEALYKDLKAVSVYNYAPTDFRYPVSEKTKPYRFKDQTENDANLKWNHYLTLFYSDPANSVIHSKTEIKPLEVTIKTDISTLFDTTNIQEKFNAKGKL
jgi:hypothetical protein